MVFTRIAASDCYAGHSNVHHSSFWLYMHDQIIVNVRANAFMLFARSLINSAHTSQ